MANKKAEEGKNPRTQVCGCEPGECNHVCDNCEGRYDDSKNSDGGVCDCNRPAKEAKEEKKEESKEEVEKETEDNSEEEKSEEEGSEVEAPPVEPDEEKDKEGE